MLRKKSLFLTLAFAVILTISPACSDDGGDDGDDGDGGGGSNSIEVNVNYTGTAGTVSETNYLFCTAIAIDESTGKATKMDIPPFCQIFEATGSCTISDIDASEMFLMVSFNVDASSALGDTGPMSAGDPWQLYNDMNPADVFSDPDNNIPEIINPAETDTINVTLTDDYIATDAALADMLVMQNSQ